MRERHDERADEGGFVYVWFAMVIALLLGVSAFTIDILHGYSVAQEAQNAADAGALAGVVFVPDVTAATPLAQSVAMRNAGVGASDVTVTAGALQNQLRVEVHKKVDTFFAGIFGIRSIDVTRASTAEYDPPVAMGSPLNSFGNVPGCTTSPTQTCAQPRFWATAGGPLSSKQSGDAAMFGDCDRPPDGLPGGYHDSDNCSAGNNSDFEGTSVFVVDVRTPGNVQVDLFDPAYVSVQPFCNDGSLVNEYLASGLDPRLKPNDPAPAPPQAECTGDGDVRFKGWENYWIPGPQHDNRKPPGVDLPCVLGNETCHFEHLSEGLGDPGTPDYSKNISVRTRFTVYDDDATDHNPYDNNVVSAGGTCSHEYRGHSNAMLAHTEDAPLFNNEFRKWTTLCTFNAPAPGKYTLKVTTAAGTQGANGYGITAWHPGVSGVDRDEDPNVSVYAVDRMGVFTNDADNTGEFYLARVIPSSRDRKLRINLFDVGDNTGSLTAKTILRIAPLTTTKRGPDLTASPAFGDFGGCVYGAPGSAVSGVSPWKQAAPFYGTPTNAGSVCEIPDVTRGTHNGRWITVEVPIPKEYNCNANDPKECWIKIFFTTPSTVTDISTWTASMSESPVHLVE